MRVMQSSPVPIEEDPSPDKDPTSQNQQPATDEQINYTENLADILAEECTSWTGSCIPSHRSWGSNDIYARDNPLKDKESKYPASLASYNPRRLQDWVLIWIAQGKEVVMSMVMSTTIYTKYTCTTPRRCNWMRYQMSLIDCTNFWKVITYS